MDSETKAIIEGMARVELYNADFRQPNPKGKYPACKPRIGEFNSLCVRCGEVIISGKPCPAVPVELRWGEDSDLVN